MSSMVLCDDGSVDDSARSTSLGASSCDNHLWYVDGEHPISYASRKWPGRVSFHVLCAQQLIIYLCDRYRMQFLEENWW
jgi:hypothetical protein